MWIEGVSATLTSEATHVNNIYSCRVQALSKVLPDVMETNLAVASDRLWGTPNCQQLRAVHQCADHLQHGACLPASTCHCQWNSYLYSSCGNPQLRRKEWRGKMDQRPSSSSGPMFYRLVLDMRATNTGWDPSSPITLRYRISHNYWH